MEEDKYTKVPTTNNRLLRTHAVPMVGGMYKPGSGELPKPLSFDKYEDYEMDYYSRYHLPHERLMTREKWVELKRDKIKSKNVNAAVADSRTRAANRGDRYYDAQEDYGISMRDTRTEPEAAIASRGQVETAAARAARAREEEESKPTFTGTREEYERRKRAKK